MRIWHSGCLRRISASSWLLFVCVCLLLGGIARPVRSGDKFAPIDEPSTGDRQAADSDFDVADLDLPYTFIIETIQQASDTLRPVSQRVALLDSCLGLITLPIVEQAAHEMGMGPDMVRQTIRLLEPGRDTCANELRRSFDDILTKRIDLGQSREIYDVPIHDAVDVLSRALSRSLCELMTLGLRRTAASFAPDLAAGLFEDPCAAMIKSTVTGVVKRLKLAAVLHCNPRCEFAIERHIRDNIMEIATVKDSFVVAHSATHNYAPLRWIRFMDSKVKTSSSAMVRAGFDLEKYFKVEIDEADRTIDITLPEPTILSVDPDYRIERIKHGVYPIDATEITEAIAQTKEKLREAAIESGILDHARETASSIIPLIMAPPTASFFADYTVRVGFADVDNSVAPTFVEKLAETPTDPWSPMAGFSSAKLWSQHLLKGINPLRVGVAAFKPKYHILSRSDPNQSYKQRCDEMTVTFVKEQLTSGGEAFERVRFFNEEETRDAIYAGWGSAGLSDDEEQPHAGGISDYHIVFLEVTNTVASGFLNSRHECAVVARIYEMGASAPIRHCVLIVDNPYIDAKKLLE